MAFAAVFSSRCCLRVPSPSPGVVQVATLGRSAARSGFHAALPPSISRHLRPHCASPSESQTLLTVHGVRRCTLSTGVWECTPAGHCRVQRVRAGFGWRDRSSQSRSSLARNLDQPASTASAEAASPPPRPLSLSGFLSVALLPLELHPGTRLGVAWQTGTNDDNRRSANTNSSAHFARSPSCALVRSSVHPSTEWRACNPSPAASSEPRLVSFRP